MCYWNVTAAMRKEEKKTLENKEIKSHTNNQSHIYCNMSDWEGKKGEMCNWDHWKVLQWIINITIVQECIGCLKY